MSDEAFDELCMTIDPWKPFPKPPGSDLKIAFLRERFARGVHPVWDQRDATLAYSSRMMDGFISAMGSRDDEGVDEGEESDEW